MTTLKDPENVTENIEIATRTVRQVRIRTGRPWADFRATYEEAVPAFDRLEALGTVLSGSGWEAIERLSAATAVHGFVNFFTFDPSPVMAVNGNTGHAVTYLVGNIIEAERGFRQNPACFLYLPLRIVIVADEKNDAELVVDHPGDLFAAFGDPTLDDVADRFSKLFATLLDHLGLPVPPAIRQYDS